MSSVLAPTSSMGRMRRLPNYLNGYCSPTVANQELILLISTGMWCELDPNQHKFDEFTTLLDWLTC